LLIEGFAKGDLPVSTLSSLAGIFSAISLYISYSSILENDGRLTAAIVMIIFQAILSGINFFVMLYMWRCKLTNYSYTKSWTIFFQVSDFILEIIIVSLISKVKAEYDKEYSHVMANAVQVSA
jgi:hypothetical protein